MNVIKNKLWVPRDKKLKHWVNVEFEPSQTSFLDVVKPQTHTPKGKTLWCEVRESLPKSEARNAIAAKIIAEHKVIPNQRDSKRILLPKECDPDKDYMPTNETFTSFIGTDGDLFKDKTESGMRLDVCDGKGFKKIRSSLPISQERKQEIRQAHALRVATNQNQEKPAAPLNLP
jgi:hypothetical protein